MDNMLKVQKALQKLEKKSPKKVLNKPKKGSNPEVVRPECAELCDELRKTGLLPENLEKCIRFPWAPFIFANPKEGKSLPDLYIPLYPKRATKSPKSKVYNNLGCNVNPGQLLIVEGDVFRRWAEAFLETHGTLNTASAKNEDNLIICPEAVANARKKYYLFKECDYIQLYKCRNLLLYFPKETLFYDVKSTKVK